MTSTRGSHGHSPKNAVPRPSLSERREHVLDEITYHRIQMREAAQTLLTPVHRAEDLRGRVSDARHWLYPAAPLLAMLVFRLRLFPRFRTLPALALRGWTLWRLIKRFR